MTTLSDGPTHLYRHFDVKGVLLYIGIAAHVTARSVQHSKHAHWRDAIARIDVQTFPTRAAAMEAEAKAIEKEKPLHNIIHNRDNQSPKKVRAALAETAERLVGVVVMRPLYDSSSLAALLGVPTSTVQRIWGSGDLGFGYIGSRKVSTGWQVIEYLEAVERTGRKRT